ncbi:type III secretion system chaperone [uncultured Hydrogenophaga sp.]|uniref:type III secretion system chaperone n=1 Tax=uncultured Hydrogenophaga sp. TaxID=199683 RepID=UPI00258F6CE0|nr:type III secretion system chaperone [uncultured Hydrogenophaga sp.]
MPHPSPTPPDAVTWLLQDLAPQSADVASVVQNDTNAWSVSFRDDSQLQVTWLEGPPRLELLARITRLDPLVAREVLEGLLMFNLLSADSRGARMALSASDRSLYLMRDLPLESLHFDGLCDALRSLAGVSGQWREALTAQEARQTTSSTFPF